MSDTQPVREKKHHAFAEATASLSAEEKEILRTALEIESESTGSARREVRKKLREQIRRIVK